MKLFLPLVVFILSVATLALAAPSPNTVDVNRSGEPVRRTTQPYFPQYPPSCQLCAQKYPEISSCADAAPIFENATQIIWNPGAFISVIQCSCTDTFQSFFPQCVDCFIQTNQTQVLQTNNLPGVVSGIRTVCGMLSTLVGGVASTNRQLPSQTPITVAPPGATGNAASSLQLANPIGSVLLIPLIFTLVGVIAGVHTLL
ncbi:hypothetical protein FRB99_008311 [Tulasnella sp. 403]|nr:hypothetical protein FRB99_008311 [Tulasnella sp. 403]